MYFYFSEPCHETLPESPVLFSLKISAAAAAAQISSLILSMTLHNRVSRNWYSLQQAEELPVVLITFSFWHQAVQLIDQLGFHLDEEATGYELAVHVKTRSRHWEDWNNILFLMPQGCPLLCASDRFLCSSFFSEIEGLKLNSPFAYQGLNEHPWGDNAAVGRNFWSLFSYQINHSDTLSVN